MRKKTVDIDIIATSRNGDRKIMQSIRIKSRPFREKRNGTVEPDLKNIYQNNIYGKYLSWPHFDKGSRKTAGEGPMVPCVFILYLG